VDERLVHAQGALAQLVARFHGMEEVRGSSPLSSTNSTYIRLAAPPGPLFCVSNKYHKVWTLVGR
jgi:hypothetical protein